MCLPCNDSDPFNSVPASHSTSAMAWHEPPHPTPPPPPHAHYYGYPPAPPAHLMPAQCLLPVEPHVKRHPTLPRDPILCTLVPSTRTVAKVVVGTMRRVEHCWYFSFCRVVT